MTDCIDETETEEGNGVQLTDGAVTATNVAVAIATATGRDVLDVAPLGDSVDCEALNELVQNGDAALSVCFTHEKHRVLVTGDGTVDVEPRSEVDAVY